MKILYRSTPTTNPLNSALLPLVSRTTILSRIDFQPAQITVVYRTMPLALLRIWPKIAILELLTK